IVLDTETTGIDPAEGHRVIEVAAVELVNLMPTGRHYHTLIDPERDVPADATRIHGFTNAHLEGKPKFAEVADAMLAFFGSADIIAHNAAFDFNHLDAELARCGRAPLDRARMVDTLALARERFPGMPNSLDALCRRFGIDLSQRTTHNALLDVRLLAQVYLELKGGRQPGLVLAADATRPMVLEAAETSAPRTPRPIPVPPDRAAAHETFLRARLKDALWLKPPFASEPSGS
ncbi:MAG TPA: DNA polymerase III subunit epsilon, partial [Acetobacteraceae bacterium]|nr:DNA polymerase III subunit epsilon [Acetobacteraceae bacterium]